MYIASGKIDKERLLEKHAPLAKKLAHQLRSRLPASVEVDDLVQASMIGLIDAINRFDESHGAKFETYAVRRMRGAMIDELRSQDWLPRSARENVRDIEAALHRAQQRLGRAPVDAEVARELGVSLEHYQGMLNGCGAQLVYLEDLHADGDGESFLDRHCENPGEDPLQSLLESNFRQALIQAIKSLPERERLLMGMHYEQAMTFKEIGAVLGVSESRVCQLHSQSIIRLRAEMKLELA